MVVADRSPLRITNVTAGSHKIATNLALVRDISLTNRIANVHVSLDDIVFSPPLSKSRS